MSSRLTRRIGLVGLLAISAGAILLVGPSACSKAKPYARAERVTSRTQLIGGQDALGDIGDLKLSNGRVRFIIQGISERSNFSRGWGVYGGSLLDADIARPSGPNPNRLNGKDQFGEMFPAAFLEAVSPESVEIGNTGEDGNPATVVVKGHGAPFLTLAKFLLNAAKLDFEDKDDNLEVTNVYSLGPSDQYLTITTTISAPKNEKDNPDYLLNISSVNLLNINLAVPLGHVALFGNKNEVFIPGIGFDLRYGLEDAYKAPADLPALAGIIADLVATRGEGDVSYGLAMQPPKDKDTSYVYKNRNSFKPALTEADSPESKMLVPFVASSFTGVFTAQAPPNIPYDGSFSFTTYFIVGQGDVGSVRDTFYDIRQAQTGYFTALLREQGTGLIVPEASLVVLKKDATGAYKPFAQYHGNSEGRAQGRLEPGEYEAVVECDNRQTSAPVRFTIEAGKSVEIAGGDSTSPRVLAVPQTAILNIRVVESTDSENPGHGLPAKVSIVGVAPAIPANDSNPQPPRNFLYDLSLGERMRTTDLVNDLSADWTTRQYVERVVLTDASGRASAHVRPGKYRVLVSRGSEYDTSELGIDDATLSLPGGKVAKLVEFKAGQSVTLAATLKRVISTPGFVSADFHVHSSNSIDGHIDLDRRALSYAAEGIEVLTSTDHNVITDYAPNVQSLGLQDYMRSMVGLEMTTLEMGHFNAFPLQALPTGATAGAFEWVNLTPDVLFKTLRSSQIGVENTVVQVNHPRDTILGYFNQFSVNPETGAPGRGNLFLAPNGPAFGTDSDSSFSWQYDALEVFNGKRHELLKTYRMPDPRPTNIPNIPASVKAGDVIREPCDEGKDCTDAEYAKNAIAFPGAVEDWFLLLNNAGKTTDELYGANSPAVKSQQIKPITGTGNSDSHSLYFEEAGYPRNWVNVGKDDPRTVTDQEIAVAVHNHRVVFSNGPYIEVTAKEPSGSKTVGIGQLLTATGDSIRLHIKVQATSWVKVKRLLVYRNNTLSPVVTIELPAPEADKADKPFTFEKDVDLPLTDDAWFVVSVEGDQSMFPFLTPLEQPPLQIMDAVSSITKPLGFGGDTMKDLHPPLVGPAVPFAMTNPIWIDHDGDKVSFGRDEKERAVSNGQALVPAGTKIVPVEAAPQIDEKTRFSRPSDLSKLFRAWGHLHSH
jgi:hypothetical protein